ncbi:MAG TPA: hypothetical protein DCX03_05835 [Bacteroidales bacterium]|nr:hypothetical protein [Bacteroidales bacterium]
MNTAILSDYLSPAVINEVSKLGKDKQEKIIGLFLSEKKKKSTGVILALLGLHYIYLGKWLLLFLFAITIGGIYVWWIIDIFRVSGMVTASNDKLMYKLMETVA